MDIPYLYNILTEEVLSGFKYNSLVLLLKQLENETIEDNDLNCKRHILINRIANSLNRYNI